MDVVRPGRSEVPHLGRCPQCRDEIPTDHLVMRYRSPDRWPTLLARCPACEDVVHPA